MTYDSYGYLITLLVDQVEILAQQTYGSAHEERVEQPKCYIEEQ